MPAPLDLTNRRFGRLIALRFAGMKGPHRAWLCRCDCGTEKLVRANSLVTGQATSCGCYNRDRVSAATSERNLKHGHSYRGERSPTYRVWMNLATRKRHKKYDGVTICERWHDFDNFLTDMGPRPSPKHTIDRIDNAKGYEPGNCRWATMKVQQNNRTNNRRLTHNGETLTLMQWAERTGISRETIARRLDLLGWPVSDALTLVPNPRPRKSRSQLA